MEAYINVVWSLKQRIMYEVPSETLMRYLHAHNHIGQHIRWFGIIVYADKDAYESAHKIFTTGAWSGTSKKLGAKKRNVNCFCVSIARRAPYCLHYITKPSWYC